MPNGYPNKGSTDAWGQPLQTISGCYVSSTGNIYTNQFAQENQLGIYAPQQAPQQVQQAPQQTFQPIIPQPQPPTPMAAPPAYQPAPLPLAQPIPAVPEIKEIRQTPQMMNSTIQYMGITTVQGQVLS